DIYHFSDEKILEMGIETIPHSLWETLQEMKKDDVIIDALGKNTFEKYLNAKKKEWREYSLQVSQWEIDNYLEKY
ncbi:MAG: glutamine synthetase, partial [Candidatus Cloacimonadota bacterium]